MDDKNYNSQEAEDKWYKFWEENGLFKADPNSTKTPYSLLMPPPNVNGSLHLGHAMEHSVMDALARTKRMQGFDVLLLPGIDHAGILFEGTLNKILEKEGTSKYKLGRELWMKRAWEFKDENYNSFHETWKFMGLSADWSREVFTLDPKVQTAVLKEFETFWEQDLLYKGAYIVQWCPKDQTAIEDLEMEYEEKTEKLYFIRYPLAGTQGKEYITIATARPETIYADVAIAVHPDDPRYKSLIGREARKPLFKSKDPSGDRVKIIADKRVDIEFGTGALKITPGHDPMDYQIGKDNNLPILHAVDKTGKMTEIANELIGLKVAEARIKAEELLQKSGALEKIEEYTHSVPVCERCKTTVEPLISEEWFIKMKPLAKKALENLDKVKFVPENYLDILKDWLENIHDWSISRSLWWGHRIPVWYCSKCNPNQLVGKDKDMVISLEEPGKNCQSCNEKHWVQDEQVLDTWFSSGMWPLATLGWPEKTPELEKYYPWDFETSAPEIKFLWIIRMIMLGLHFEDDIPFKTQFFHGMLRDLQGRKFSKSLGNGIDPYEVVKQWGVDATRMALYSYSIPGRDARTSRQTMDQRCKNFRNFQTKLFNIYKFIYELAPDGSSHFEGTEKSQFTHDEDIEIIQHLNGLKDQVGKNIDDLQLHLATEQLYDFAWNKFASSYLEWTKKRRSEAQPCLEYVFEDLLKLLHPFMPYITEDLWQKIHPGASIMKSSWPSEYSIK